MKHKNSIFQKIWLVIFLFLGVSYAESNTHLTQEKDFYLRLMQAKILDDAKEVFTLVNELRAKGCSCGGQKMTPVPALQWNDKLAKAALKHCEDMRNNNNFSHTGTDGSEHWERMEREGYDWGRTGENIAWGQNTAQEVVKAWEGSTGHCKNMMSGDFTEIGVGRSGTYWTQVFGTPL